MTSPRLLVDLSAVAHNVRHLLAGSSARDLVAVVKADGFGHGAEQVARAAVDAGAGMLGTTSLEEAAPLQHLGVPVLSWLNPVGADYADPRTRRVQLAVPSVEHLDAVTAAAERARRRRQVHLFVDAGMSRDGCDPAEWLTLCVRARAAERAGHLEVVGVMGHLGVAEPEHPLHRAAVERYARAVRVARGTGLRPRMRHLAATAAALRAPGAHHDTLRVGAGLVGIDPVAPDGTREGAQKSALRAAATLTAPFVQVRRVGAGRPVGYGQGHLTERATWLGLLPVGYADGVPRRASGRAEVLVRGRRRPLVGWVSMDQVVVDLGDDPVQVGEEAVIFGPGGRGEPTLTEWAQWGDTIEHEVITGIGARVRRVHVQGVHVQGVHVQGVHVAGAGRQGCAA